MCNTVLGSTCYLSVRFVPPLFPPPPTPSPHRVRLVEPHRPLLTWEKVLKTVCLWLGLAALALSAETTTTKSTKKPVKRATHATSAQTPASHTKSSAAKSSRAKTSHTTTASSSKTGAAKTTASKTTSKTKGKRRTTARSYQKAPTPERYREIQQALITKGYLQGEPSGEWGPDSAEALKRFQTDQNLTPDGKLGSLSLIALGLGPKRLTAQASPVRQPASTPVPPPSTTVSPAAPAQPVMPPPPANPAAPVTQPPAADPAR